MLATVWKWSTLYCDGVRRWWVEHRFAEKHDIFSDWVKYVLGETRCCVLPLLELHSVNHVFGASAALSLRIAIRIR